MVYNLAKAFEEKAFSYLEQGNKTKENRNFVETTNNYRKALLYKLEAETISHLPVIPASLEQLFVINGSILSSERIIFNSNTPVNILKYSQDSKVLAIGSEGGVIDLLDIQSGKQIRSLHRHNSDLTALTYSPDNAVIASGFSDGKVWLWNAKTGEIFNILKNQSNPVDMLTYSSDGKLLTIVSGGATSVQQCDAKTGTALKLDLLKNHAISNISAYSPDGKMLAFGDYDNNSVYLWSLEKKRIIKTLIPPLLTSSGATGKVSDLKFSPNGKMIATATMYGEDNAIYLWDTQTGKQLNTLKGHTFSVFALAYSPDSKVLASGSEDKTIRLWDTETGKELNVFCGHIGGVSALAYSPNGKTIASVSNEDNTIRVWDAITMMEPKLLNGFGDEVDAVAYTPDGQTLASGSFDYYQTHGPYNSLIDIFDIKTGEKLKTIRSDYDGGVSALEYSPDGKVLASGSGAHRVNLWDMQTGKAQTLTGQQDGISIVLAYSPQGKILAAGSLENEVQLWNVQAGVEIKSLDTEASALAYSPDGGMLASGSSDGLVRLWDEQTGKKLRDFGNGHTQNVSALAYNPRNRKMLASASWDGTVRIWDTQAGIVFNVLRGHEGKVNALAYKPDGQVLASGGEDHTVRLWNAQTGEVLDTLTGSTPVYALAFSPDGKVIAIGSVSMVRLWKPTDPVYKLLYKLDPSESFKTLCFLWELNLDGLEFKPKNPAKHQTSSDGYFYEYDAKYHSLLDAPSPDETKLDQVVRFLEAECAYKDPDKKKACKAKK